MGKLLDFATKLGHMIEKKEDRQLKTDVVEDRVENSEAKMELDEQPLEKDQVEPQVETTGEKCEEDPQEKNRFEVVENEAENTVEIPDEE
ncbi:unnamed protein product, partial [Linum tenue]